MILTRLIVHAWVNLTFSLCEIVGLSKIGLENKRHQGSHTNKPIWIFLGHLKLQVQPQRSCKMYFRNEDEVIRVVIWVGPRIYAITIDHKCPMFTIAQSTTIVATPTTIVAKIHNCRNANENCHNLAQSQLSQRQSQMLQFLRWNLFWENCVIFMNTHILLNVVGYLKVKHTSISDKLS